MQKYVQAELCKTGKPAKIILGRIISVLIGLRKRNNLVRKNMCVDSRQISLGVGLILWILDLV